MITRVGSYVNHFRRWESRHLGRIAYALATGLAVAFLAYGCNPGPDMLGPSSNSIVETSSSPLAKPAVIPAREVIPAASNGLPDRYIVTLTGSARADEVLAQHGITPGFKYTHALNGFAGVIPEGRMAALQRDPRVVRIEQDARVTIAAQVLPLGIDRVEADLNPTAAIDGVDGRVDVDIAILDTGIDPNHPDLNVVSWANFVGGADADGHGHGTHVAGTAAALDNGIGVVGVAPGARLWAVKVLDDSGWGSWSQIIAGIDYVTRNADKIDVANMSLGGTGWYASLHDAIKKSVAAGVCYVVAAGNNGGDVFGSDGAYKTGDEFIPAAFPEVAAVSAIQDLDGKSGGLAGSSDDRFASFSNYGRAAAPGNPVSSPGLSIDLAAPGVSIYSTVRGGGYSGKSGTSMASPHVAGLAGLYIAANGRATDAAGVAAIRQALIDSGQPQADWRPDGNTGDRDGNRESLADARYLGEVVPRTDVAIASVAVADPVLTGATYSVDVEVANLGNQSVAGVGVTLVSANFGPVGAATLAEELFPGDRRIVTFPWTIDAAAVLGPDVLTAAHDLADANPGNDAVSVTTSVEQPLDNLSVTGVALPGAATVGDLVQVRVDVANTGNLVPTEPVQVTLDDMNAGMRIGSQTISAPAAGDVRAVYFSWSTVGAAQGDHTMKASHDRADGRPDDDAKTGTIALQAPASSIHVTDVALSMSQKGKNTTFAATVHVETELATPASGASVTGVFTVNGASVGTGSSTTDAAGTARFVSDRVSVQPGDVAVFEVVTLTHSSLTYAPQDDVTTAASLTVPADGGSGGPGKGNGRKK